MSVKDRGFGSMKKERIAEIAAMGGRAAHKKGTAHRWTKKSAVEAGRKGGQASGVSKRKKSSDDAQEVIE